MRVNVYAEEMTDRIEIIEKTIEGNKFTALRIYLDLPASFVSAPSGLRPAEITDKEQAVHFKGPFIHHPGDDDSSAVTFWGKTDLRVVLRSAIEKLDAHYAAREVRDAPCAAEPMLRARCGHPKSDPATGYDCVKCGVRPVGSI